MKSNPSICFVFAFLLMIAVSCKKTGNNITGGGKGGNVTIKVIAEHFNYVLDTATVYVKYGATKVPPNGVVCDDSAACVLIGTMPVATFSNLTIGNYALLAKGYHANISPFPTVEGATVVTISQNGTTNNIVISTGEYNPNP